MIRSSSLTLCALSLSTLLTMTGCRTVAELAVGGLAEAVAGDSSEGGGTGTGLDAVSRAVQDEGDARRGESVASVYEAGPTPGWERGFRARASVGSSYYRNSLCLNVPLRLDVGRLWSGEAPDPFGPVDRPRYQLLLEGNTQGIDLGYTRLGEVRLGGPSPTGEMWQSLELAGMAGTSGASCPVLGIFATGRTDGAGVIHR